MAKNNKKISSHIKSSVLLELKTGERSITQLANSHGISRAIIYTWLKELQAAKTQQVSDIKLSFPNNFVEVPLIDNQAYQSSNLQKISLKFNDFSLFIEGSVNATKLLRILKNLEEIC